MPSAPNPSELGHERSGFSCISCRRRKVKCDRSLPSCDTCRRIFTTCSYPTEARKPGPRLGSSSVPRKRRRQSGTDASSSHDRPETLPRRKAESRAEILPDLVHSSPGTEKPYDVVHRLPSILHPSHELIPTPTSSPSIGDVEDATHEDAQPSSVVFHEACRSLGICSSTAHTLIDVYLSHVTIFSLFHKPSFKIDLLRITPKTHLIALLAAMFTLSARFAATIPAVSIQGHSIPPPSYFQAIAVTTQRAALDALGDSGPPLCLVQAFILTTFQHLIQGVRGVAWRYLGNCIRLAYEIGLHQVDSDVSSNDKQGADPEEVLRKEEKRRAWWAIWEMDTFGSTIRRLPTGIDWSRNETFLPIPDELWYNCQKQDSCFLDSNPTARWKNVQKSGNQACKAWFIVVNSLMRDVQVLSDPRGISLYQKGGETAAPKNIDNEQQIMERLDTICNTISCITVAIPKNIQYHGENLTFTAEDPAQAAFDRQSDGAKLGIHVMIQLTRLMVGHFRAFHASDLDHRSPHGYQKQALNNFVSGADNILTVISRSAENHVQHVSPFFASYIWVAAATQLLQKHFGGSTVNMELVESKYELLKINHTQYVEFWGTPSVLEQRLDHLERYFEELGNEADKGRETSRAERNTEASFVGNAWSRVTHEGDLGQIVALSNQNTSGLYAPESISDLISSEQKSSYPHDGTLDIMSTENYSTSFDFVLPPLLDGELNMPLFLDNLIYGSYSP